VACETHEYHEIRVAELAEHLYFVIEAGLFWHFKYLDSDLSAIIEDTLVHAAIGA
jgi:hypothetical protein